MRAACLAASLVLALPSAAFAHAVLVASTPGAKAVLPQAPVAVDLKFNSRVDQAHSRLYLAGPDGQVETLALKPDAAAGELGAKTAKLAPGSYTLRWQVLATDGHITRGEIPFTVR